MEKRQSKLRGGETGERLAEQPCACARIANFHILFRRKGKRYWGRPLFQPQFSQFRECVLNGSTNTFLVLMAVVVVSHYRLILVYAMPVSARQNHVISTLNHVI
jgi:hypothetical protein